MRTVGTVVRGIRTPIIRTGDPLQQIVVESLLNAAKEERFSFRDKDVVAVTEAVVAIAQGNYATVDQIASDVRNKFPSGHIGVVFPSPLSRNRFAIILRGIARGARKLTIHLRYPADEVGNSLFREDLLEKYRIDPWTDVLSEKEYVTYFGDEVHPFTGINYVRYYREIVEKEGCEIEYLFSNRAITILDYCQEVLVANVHQRQKTKRQLREAGAKIVFGTDDILTQSVQGSGFNPLYGLLGSNKATEEKVKLFPRDGDPLVNGIQKELREKTSKEIEVMVYGDGAFKDPAGGIWELADPVTSPFYTKGLEGTPNEIKLKYVLDSQFASLRGEELNQAIKETIRQKDKNLKGMMLSQGTTPRRLTDLLSSLCDLTTGSGDKGTPVVLIQGYFDNYSDA
ncbi:MAG TPA: coenzyme F420-0:L-glutamate ligase [Thermotogota bacterium]|nr:coenzyme F420-0:L-glutamate ligase [Thermotogota bacterium]